MPRRTRRSTAQARPVEPEPDGDAPYVPEPDSDVPSELEPISDSDAESEHDVSRI
jgi:hypothetical protein